MNWAYMVRCADGSLYAGWTNDLEKRLAAHNGGTGAKYTRARRPVALAWASACPTKQEAMAAEARLKRLGKAAKEALAAEYAGAPAPKLAAALPAEAGGVLLEEATVEGLLHLYAQARREPPGLMSCRPERALSRREAAAFYERQLYGTSVFTFAVYAGGAALPARPAGKITLYDYNPLNRSAELGFYLLPGARGRGVMTKALEAACALALGPGGLGKLCAQTGAFNTPAIALLEGLGFRLEGVLRRHHLWEGALYDERLYSLTQDDWRRRTPD